MLLPVFLALFLPCVGMSVVFLVYICLLWYAASRNSGQVAQTPPPPPPPEEKALKQEGLSQSDLEKLPKITGNDLVIMDTECVVCLEEIKNDQQVRLIPICNHGFHVQCADTWLSKNPICPLCRSKLQQELFKQLENDPC